MSKRCPRCGSLATDDERFCTKCGENLSDVASDGIHDESMSYTGQYAYTPPSYNYQKPAEQEMSLGKWVGTIVVTTFFGIISIIFLFIWGFGDGPETRKRFCKAMLIVKAISIVVSIILLILYMAVLGRFIRDFDGGYWDSYGRYNDQGYSQEYDGSIHAYGDESQL